MVHTGNSVLIWPLLVYGIAVVLLVSGILLVSRFLGERHEETSTDEVYEAGIIATGTARLQFPVVFYVVAMFFVIFDVETFFIMSWAISIRGVGWGGYIAIIIFIGILMTVLVYEWSVGALDFGPSGKNILKAYRNKILKTGSV